MPRLLCLLAVVFLSPAGLAAEPAIQEEDVALHDPARNRDVPVHLYKPSAEDCCEEGLGPVALLSHGYGVGHREYSFLARALAARGFLVVAVQHDLPGDAPIPREGNVQEVRSPWWKRGSENLLFVRAQLRERYPVFDWEHPVLVGHSNGGDISMWLTRDHPSMPAAVITLDHRRMPVPRVARPPMLLLRGSDFPADPGVLPSEEEQKALGIEVAPLAGARHDDMLDAGPEPLKRAIVERTIEFLAKLKLGTAASSGSPTPAASPAR